MVFVLVFAKIKKSHLDYAAAILYLPAINLLLTLLIQVLVLVLYKFAEIIHLSNVLGANCAANSGLAAFVIITNSSQMFL